MNRLKILITTTVLIMCLFSMNICVAGERLENETPSWPVFNDDKKDETPDNNETDNSTDNSTNSGSSDNDSNNDSENNIGNDDNNNSESNNGENNNSGNNNNAGAGGSGGGGGSYRPSPKPTDKTEIPQEPTPQEPTPQEPTQQEPTQQEPTQTENNVKTFSDIKQDDWFYNDVMFVFDNKIMTGTSESEFSPDTTLNRAMMITILHRIDGDNSVYEKDIFNDVEKNSWYENAVKWGFENKIVSGTGEKTFAPMDNLTREQLCVMLYNYTQHIGVETEFADISAYSDNDTVSDWAKDAVSWAVQEKIVTGKGNNTLAPNDSATRAEAAAVIRRYTEKFAEIEGK